MLAKLSVQLVNLGLNILLWSMASLFCTLWIELLVTDDFPKDNLSLRCLLELFLITADFPRKFFNLYVQSRFYVRHKLLYECVSTHHLLRDINGAKTLSKLAPGALTVLAHFRIGVLS